MKSVYLQTKDGLKFERITPALYPFFGLLSKEKRPTIQLVVQKIHFSELVIAHSF